ncbi:hypothetical protein [Streptomyces scopuliridis]|uniref:hypothetical protein n=1 Tax=Streptomyces scopuliridis TaxID=452529 RepID=UPI003433623D
MPITAPLLTRTALAAAAIALTVAGNTAAFAEDRDGSWDAGRGNGPEGSWDAGGGSGPEGSWDAGGGNGPEGSWDSGRDRGKPGRLELSPKHVRPGTTVTAKTTGCGRDGRARGFAESVGAGEFRLDRVAGKEAVAGKFRVAHHARTGNHRIRVRCDNGREAHGDLFVEHGGPTGHVRTGVGGSVTTDTTQIAAGVAVLASAAVGGTWLLRRRASGTQAS